MELKSVFIHNILKLNASKLHVCRKKNKIRVCECCSVFIKTTQYSQQQQFKTLNYPDRECFDNCCHIDLRRSKFWNVGLYFIIY